LTALYPEPPLDPGHPRYRELERARLMEKEREEHGRIIRDEHFARLVEGLEIAPERERKPRLEEEQLLRRWKKLRDDAAEQIDSD
jgi:hypothetical protein